MIKPVCRKGDLPICSIMKKTFEIDRSEPNDFRERYEGSWLVSVVEGMTPSASRGTEETIQERISRWQSRGITPEDEKKAGIHYSRSTVPSYSFRRSGNDFILIGHKNAARAEIYHKSSSYIGEKASDILRKYPDILRDIRECYEEKSTSIRQVRLGRLSAEEDRELAILYNYIPPDTVQVITHDVTELKLMRVILKESEKKYRSIFESALAGIYRYSIKDKKILMANQALANMLGYDSVRQLLSETTALKRYFSPENSRKLIQQLKRDGRVDGFEFEVIKSDGKRIPLLLSAIFYPDQGYLEGVAINIRERKRAEEAIKNSRHRLRMLSAQLLLAQERERKQIANELHDSIGQSLTAIKYGIESVSEEMDKEPVAVNKSALLAVLSILQEVTDEVRNIQTNLRPPILDDIGLLPAISWFCREFQKIYSRLRIIRLLEIEESDIPDSLKIVIFRIMQEALNNAAKHSEAECVHFSLRKSENAIEMSVQDDGRGFDLEKVLNTKELSRGFGLETMKERAELSGGRFEIESKKAKGTTIRTLWPLKDR